MLAFFRMFLSRHTQFSVTVTSDIPLFIVQYEVLPFFCSSLLVTQDNVNKTVR